MSIMLVTAISSIKLTSSLTYIEHWKSYIIIIILQFTADQRQLYQTIKNYFNRIITSSFSILTDKKAS